MIAQYISRYSISTSQIGDNLEIEENAPFREKHMNPSYAHRSRLENRERGAK